MSGHWRWDGWRGVCTGDRNEVFGVGDRWGAVLGGCGGVGSRRAGLRRWIGLGGLAAGAFDVAGVFPASEGLVVAAVTIAHEGIELRGGKHAEGGFRF